MNFTNPLLVVLGFAQLLLGIEFFLVVVVAHIEIVIQLFLLMAVLAAAVPLDFLLGMVTPDLQILAAAEAAALMEQPQITHQVLVVLVS